MNRGDIWGKWVIRQYLGGGGMGEVYLAMNLETSANVALKRVRRTPGADGEEKVAAERMGAELEQRLSEIDPRVTKVFWFGDVQGDLAIEMEYIDGEDLAARLAGGVIDPGRAAVIAADICEMLRNLRGLGVIHGDLKPKNIRIDKREQVKVMDFGVAKALSHTRDYTASLFGSIAYCSPERLETGSMDASSDLWSVGVILYQMIAGRLPFEGATAEKLERRIRTGGAAPALSDDCPEGLRRVVAKMLTRNLQERYPTETEAREDIERFLRGEAVEAPPVVASDAARPEDSNATVRTVRAGFHAQGIQEHGVQARELNATVRTKPGPIHWPNRSPMPPPNQVPWKVVAAAAMVALFSMAWLVVPQYQAWADTRELKHEIEAEQVNADQAWKKYQQIVERKRQGIVSLAMGGTLKAQLVSAGDRPILDFRNNDYPAAREAQWRSAATYFSRALAMDSGDKSVKARLRICEGHLQRITATGASKQQMLNEAAMKFEEAAVLWKASPDPYLGLERLYAYSDPDRALAAAKQAEKCGHTETRREMAQLADGFFRRGAQTVHDAQKLKGVITTGSEYEYWFRARQDFIQARQLYARVGSYGNAPNSLIDSVRGLDLVQARLQEMDSSKP